jgi:RNA polymerase sigma-70 factor (ECF subfamily)
MHNLNVNEVRRATREGVQIPLDDVSSLRTVATQIPSLMMRDLNRSLARLPQEQRQVLLLVGIEGMRYEEVAEVLNVPVGTVRSRVSRGRDTLRHLMDIEMPAPQIAAATSGEHHPAAA